MNKKGFTLFTALISLLLVSVALSLIFNMINTEDTYLSLIQDQSSMSDLMTIADLARADAFNTFIITLRSNWEEHMSRNHMLVTRDQMDMNWDDFTQWFIKDNFFERAFPAYFAQGILFNLKYKMEPPGYDIQTETNTGTKMVCTGGCEYGDPVCSCTIEETDPNSDTNNLFIDVVVDIFKAGGEKADIIDCNQTDTNCNGSFFLTLDTTQLADENYELLPIVTVLRTKSNQVIQRPVLSRQIYKIYMPWRGLQALRTARNIVLDNDTEENENPATHENVGFFSPTIHNTLEQARLGYCDPGTCVPRNNFFVTPNTTGSDSNYCHEISKTLETSIPNNLLDISNVSGLIQTYDLSVDNIKTPFEALYKQTFNNNISERTAEKITYNNGLIMDGDPIYAGSDINISEILLDVDIERSKTYMTETPKGPEDYTVQTFDNISKINNLVGGLGLFLKDGKSAFIWDVANSWYNNPQDVNLPADSMQHAAELKCAEINNVTITLDFNETDPRYKIKDTYKGTATKITVRIVDDFTDFYFTPGDDPASWAGLNLISNSSYLDPDSVGGLDQAVLTELSDEQLGEGNQLWTCYSQVSAGNSAKTCGPKKS